MLRRRIILYVCAHARACVCDLLIFHDLHDRPTPPPISCGLFTYKLLHRILILITRFNGWLSDFTWRAEWFFFLSNQKNHLALMHERDNLTRRDMTHPRSLQPWVEEEQDDHLTRVYVCVCFSSFNDDACTSDMLPCRRDRLCLQWNDDTSLFKLPAYTVSQ